MSQTVILASERQRQIAHSLIERAPPGAVIKIAEGKRTTAQSDKMWSMLGDISRQKPLGRRHTPEQWKALAMHACGWAVQFEQGLDGQPFPAGFRSSRMTKSQMANLIEWLYSWGADQGIRWSEPTPEGR